MNWLVQGHQVSAGLIIKNLTPFKKKQKVNEVEPVERRSLRQMNLKNKINYKYLYQVFQSYMYHEDMYLPAFMPMA